MGLQEAAPVPFLNPDPVAHLVGHSNNNIIHLYSANLSHNDNDILLHFTFDISKKI